MSEGESTPEKRESEKSRIVKAKAGGFAQGKAIEPVKKVSTEKIDEKFDEKIDKLSNLMRQSFEDAMAPTQPIKVRVDAANKLMNHLYRPTQTVRVEGDVNNGNVVFNISQVETMSAEDRVLFERAKKASEQEVIEGEVVDD